MSRLNFMCARHQGVGLAYVLLAFALTAVAPVWAQEQTPPLAPDKGVDKGVDKLGVQSPQSEPTGPIEGEPESQAESLADAAAAQAALQSELASAKRFEIELASLLQPDGQLDTAQGDEALTRLTGLATRCGILANSAMHDEVRLVLLGYQARALGALVSLGHNDDQDGPDWISQLGQTAQQIAALQPLPGAGPAADYWSLIAELSSPLLHKQTAASQQARAELALLAYIQAHDEDTAAAEYLLDCRLSLAGLLDQRGAQREAAALLDRLGETPEDGPRVSDIKRLRESVGRVGKPIAFELISTELVRWRLSDHTGKPVLIHVYAQSVDASVRMIDVINGSIGQGSLGGIAVVSLRVGEPIAAKASPPWPTLPVQLEQGGVLDQLGVTALPTLAWLDQEGKLVSIGTTSAVLNQFASINHDDPAEPDALDNDAQPDAQTQPESEPEPQPTTKPQETTGDAEDD